MKRLICTVLAFSLLCPLTGCQKSGLPQPDFPLSEEVVTAALEQTGLPGSISESETRSSIEGHISYTLREQTESKAMTTAISSALTKGNRFLQIIYMSPPAPEASSFAWEDWKQQFTFASLLYGGFADEAELYTAFSAKSASEGEITPEGGESWTASGRLEWTAQLPAGYCIVRYYLVSSEAERDSADTGNLKKTPRMTITISASEEAYQESRQKTESS